MGSFDIVTVADPRFSGGSSAALVADVRAFLSLGARVGLLPVTSRFFGDGGDAPNRDVTGLTDLAGVDAVAPGSSVRASTVFFHHPLVFFHGVAERCEIQAERAVLVAHQPPFRGDGSLEHDPLLTTARIRRAFGVTPMWGPVSGVVRRQLGSFAPLIRLTSADWINIFDPEGWQAGRLAFSGQVPTIGRHGRPDPLKWPDAAADIAAHLPARDGWRVRVMGCPEAALRTRGADLAGWEVLPFNAESPAAFLESLDVFAYFHSDRWVEAFGRVVVEAMLMERPCLLDRRLEPTFGNLALYCRPAEAPTALASLRDTPALVRRMTARARAVAAARYSANRMAERLRDLAADRGERVARGRRYASWMTVARKIVGLHRRRLQERSATTDTPRAEAPLQ